MEVLKEHPNNEHWWEVRNNIGEVGFIPSSYILIQYQTLPWLQEAALACEEEERKERVTRLKQQKSAQEGTGWGPCPKNLVSSLPSKVLNELMARVSSILPEVLEYYRKCLVLQEVL